MGKNAARTVVANAELPRSYEIQALISLENFFLTWLFTLNLKVFCIFYIKKSIENGNLFVIFLLGVFKWTIVQH